MVFSYFHCMKQTFTSFIQFNFLNIHGARNLQVQPQMIHLNSWGIKRKIYYTFSSNISLKGKRN